MIELSDVKRLNWTLTLEKFIRCLHLELPYAKYDLLSWRGDLFASKRWN